MQVCSINLFKPQTQYNTRIAVSNNKHNVILNEMNCDSVSFSGAAKFLSDEKDQAFVDVLVKDLKLDDKASVKLKNAVWDFLRENKLQSLSEIGGEEYIDMHCELQKRITEAANLSEDSGDYLANEIIRRCDDGEAYVPNGMRGFKRNNIFGDVILGHFSLKDAIKKSENDVVDDKLYSFASKMLRLSPSEGYDFRSLIENYLEENNLESIKELFSSDNLIEEQAALIDKLSEEFNLSETESMALDFEFMHRSMWPSNVEYEPFNSPYIGDSALLDKVIDDGHYNYNVGREKFNIQLFTQMSEEAKQNKYDNIFEIFKQKNNPGQSETIKLINNSKLSNDQKINLILDLSKIAKDPEGYMANIPKNEMSDNFYAGIQIEMIKEHIAEIFNIDRASVFGTESIYGKILSDYICKLFPEHVRGGENADIHQVAFEIADKFKLPISAELKIIEIIKDVLGGGTRYADEYLINKLLSGLEA